MGLNRPGERPTSSGNRWPVHSMYGTKSDIWGQGPCMGPNLYILDKIVSHSETESLGVIRYCKIGREKRPDPTTIYHGIVHHPISPM